MHLRLITQSLTIPGALYSFMPCHAAFTAPWLSNSFIRTCQMSPPQQYMCRGVLYMLIIAGRSIGEVQQCIHVHCHCSVFTRTVDGQQRLLIRARARGRVASFPPILPRINRDRIRQSDHVSQPSRSQMSMIGRSDSVTIHGGAFAQHVASSQSQTGV